MAVQIERPFFLPNVTLISPWTGQQWAMLYRAGAGEWVAMRVPAEGERGWLHESVPGSLLDCIEPGEELPKWSKYREIRLLGDLLPSIIAGYNGDTYSLDNGMTSSLVESIAELRAKCLTNEVTTEELRQAYKTMRGERLSAFHASRAKKEAAAGPDPNAVLERIRAGRSPG